MRTPLLEGVCKGAGLEGDNERVIAPESISWVGEDEAWEGGVGEWSSFSGAHDNTEVWGDNERVITSQSISWMGEDEAWEGGVGEWSSFSGAHDNTEVWGALKGASSSEEDGFEWLSGVFGTMACWVGSWSIMQLA
jgi:hypothetical protein